MIPTPGKTGSTALNATQLQLFLVLVLCFLVPHPLTPCFQLRFTSVYKQPGALTLLPPFKNQSQNNCLRQFAYFTESLLSRMSFQTQSFLLTAPGFH